jgi:hypothetical protein
MAPNFGFGGISLELADRLSLKNFIDSSNTDF